jgi:hypothetical protein
MLARNPDGTPTRLFPARLVKARRRETSDQQGNKQPPRPRRCPATDVTPVLFEV